MTQTEHTHLQKAYDLHTTFRAWMLHLTTDYDAWENNFKLKQGFSVFVNNARRPDTPENQASKMVMYLNSKGISYNEYRDFIVVAYPGFIHSISHIRDSRVGDYLDWKDRPLGLTSNCDKDFNLYSGIPLIMMQVSNGAVSGLTAAEAINNSNSWDRLWSMKEQSNFMFDIIWAQIHRYKPLFKENNVQS